MRYILTLLICSFFISTACNYNAQSAKLNYKTHDSKIDSSDFYFQLAESANTLTKQSVVYDPAYFVIDYPNGDVPANKGVCTDVVIRALRIHRIDLQKRLHEDIKANFGKYPKIWGLKHPDKNIDHRRVPNLMTYFARKNAGLPITNNPEDYKAGSIICWQLPGGQTHIGILSNLKSTDNKRHLVVHNIGGGQVIDDCLFRFKIIGHYQYPKAKP